MVAKGFSLPPFHDGPSHAAALSLLAELVDQVREGPLAQRVHQVGRGGPGVGSSRISSGPSCAKAQAAIDGLDLVGGEAEIGEHAIDRVHPPVPQDLRQLVEVGVNQFNWQAGESRPGPSPAWSDPDRARSAFLSARFVRQ